MPSPSRAGAALFAICVLLSLAGCASPGPMTQATPSAGIEHPQRLTSGQAEELAAMRFRAHAAGIRGFDARLLSEEGDLRVIGWVDFAADTGYASVVAADSTAFLVVWDAAQVAFLDGGEAGAPQPSPPEGDWQVSTFDPGASGLTRLLAALLLLSEDRPENPQLIAQNGARYLGEEQVGDVPTSHYSGVAADAAAGDEPDLGTQYWLDGEGDLVRFGIVLAGNALSLVDFSADSVPDSVPTVASVAG
ncbi:hypothetical protein ACWGJP_15605 [Microbacterium sp. NPDC055903]